MIARPWLSRSFWNIFEQGFVRVADALATLVLIWWLPTDSFAKLALSQAWVAPALLFFVSPETALYRDFARWSAEGPVAIAKKLASFRLFALGKLQGAVLIAAAMAFTIPQTDWRTGFILLLWAFGLALAPQLLGPDREFLRLDLQLRKLNAAAILQKGVLLAGTVAAIVYFPARPEALLAAVALSTLIAGLYLRSCVNGRLQGARGVRVTPSEVLETLKDSLGTFSLWGHLNGVIFGWVQTLDLFWLGIWGLPAHEIGLYGAALKLANFAQALPMAGANTFNIWLGRRLHDSSEKSRLLRANGLFTALVALQALALGLLAPWGLSLLSDGMGGKWTPEDQRQIVGWMRWILAGGVPVMATFLITSWLSLRARIRDLFFRVSVPLGLAALAGYGGAAFAQGAHGAAVANLGVGLTFLGLVIWAWFCQGRTR